MRFIIAAAFACAAAASGQAPSVTLSPASASVMTQLSRNFLATVQNLPDTTVTWLVNGIPGGSAAAGYISSTGRYTAPVQVPSPATVQVQARSNAQPAVIASALVTITPPVPVLYSTNQPIVAGPFQVRLYGAGLLAGAIAALNGAPVTTVYNNYTQLTISGTAPAAASYSIVVTNPDGKVSNTLQIKGAIAVTVNPASASVAAHATQTFTSTVVNTPDTRVTWAVNNVAGGNSVVGTISSAGLYTAPAVNAGTTFTISATSVADPAKKASALVSVSPTAATFNRMGVVNYMTPWMKPAARDALFAFQKDKYDIFIGGASGISLSPDAIHAPYRDFSVLYSYETYPLKEIAEKHGFRYEDMLLHMGVNYRLKPGYGWIMGRFDACERWHGDTAKNGVFLVTNNDSLYTDATSAAWNTATGDVPISKRVLLGYCEPFDEATFQFSTPAGAGITATWEYWNGSAWGPLTLLSDSTGGMKKNGTVRFLPPANWTTRAENGSRKKWWVRATVSGLGTTPVASRILADDWLVPGHLDTFRGWDRNAPNRINAGLGPLEYNPAPPSNATARFRYQARFGGAWTKNLQFGNPFNVQNGAHTWIRYLVDVSLSDIQNYGANALFFDDGEALPNMVSPANWQDYTEAAGINFPVERAKIYALTREYLRTQIPGAKTCINTGVWQLAREGDCFLAEYDGDSHLGVPLRWKLQADKAAWNSASMEQLLPENNPGGVKGVFTTWDLNSDFVLNGEYVLWDRSNRGPITALAAYYIFANENSRFAYQTEKGWMYNKTDEFSYFDASPNFTLSVPVTTNLTFGAVKYLNGNFAAFPAQYNSSSSRLNVRVGSGEVLPVWKVSDTQLATDDVIGIPHPAGTGIYFLREGHLITDPLPPLSQIHNFHKWFPAAGVNIGVSDPAGYNGGVRDIAWKTAAESGTALGVRRRDFTNAVILHAPGAPALPGSTLAKYGPEIPLGRTYYPLMANGKTGPAVSSIRLRTAEGAILMKSPIL